MNAAFLQSPGESAGLFDLASFKDGISAERLKALIARGNLPSANGYVGQTPLSAQQRNEILNNRALDAVRNNSDVRFGFCVQRSDLRSGRALLAGGSGAGRVVDQRAACRRKERLARCQ